MNVTSRTRYVRLAALALPAIAVFAAPAAGAAVPAPADPAPIVLAQASTDCKGCGEVTAVRAVEVDGKGSGVGIGLGAVVGGILGNKVGGGTGRTVATVGGAVAGGYAGNEIEKKVRKDTQYEVVVKLQSGKSRVFRFDQKPHWEAGDLVKVVNGTLVERDE
jgi:outer membrane lipoprotein SlyB